jgi:hypothetical protein
VAISSARFSQKTDNNPRAFAAKVDVRRRVLQAIGADAAAVFDAFAGTGEMFSAVWKDAKRYVGCDLKHVRDGRMMFAADNRRVMRAIDLSPFNVFDLDAYGSPWEQAIIIADRRRVAPGELLGLVLTEGNGLAFKVNVVPIAIQQLAGIRRGMVGMHRNQDAAINKTIAGLARRMSCTIEKRWEAAGKTGASMRYIGLVLKGRGALNAGS